MKDLMLYIHIPFCEKKCKYCDFVSFMCDYQRIEQYIKVLLTEIEYKAYLASDYQISSIYIGGGTPSFVDSKYITFIMDSIKSHYKVKDDAEISIEVNPNSATKEKLSSYYNSGINRLSIGLQSADSYDLKTLGRVHTFNDFINAYNDAIHVGFKNINVDIINGLPNQTADTYKKSLKQVLMLNLKHLSIYNLIIEPNTVFYEMNKNGELNLPTEDIMLEIDNVTKELTQYYRLNRYEISNYAKAGFECRHNLGYWSNVPYLGFGLNSSSYIDNKRLKNKTKFNDYLNLDYRTYITDTEKQKFYDEIITLDKKDIMSEYVMLGFRKISGINVNDFKNTFNEKFTDVFYEPLKKYHELSYIKKDGDNYHLTYEGINISNLILSEFLLK